MNTPNQLDQALEALRQEHRAIQPPAHLAEGLLEQARPPRRSLPPYAWSLALAAAALAVAVIILYPRPSHPTIETRTTPLPSPKSIQTPSPFNTNINAESTRPRPHSKRKLAARHQSTPGPFVPLPTGVGLPEPTQAMLIRTRINTSSLRSYGLTSPPPGAPQTILAEFLVGEDGLPRAIRLVP